MTIDKCRELVDKAVKLQLYGADEVAAVPVETLAAECNGIGPEWFPQEIRATIDALTPDLQPAALIHDYRWSNSDGSKSDFDRSNLELEQNCARIASSYPFYHWKRYVLRHVGVAFADLCSQYGYPAYTIAYLNQKERKKNEND